MDRYALHNLTDRQLSMLWYGLFLLLNFVNDSSLRAERFGSDDEIHEMMRRTLHGDVKSDDTETTA